MTKEAAATNNIQVQMSVQQLQELCENQPDNPLCTGILPQQNEKQQSGWLWTLGKGILCVTILGLAGYGAYRAGYLTGVERAAEVAGNKFKNFWEEVLNSGEGDTLFGRVFDFSKKTLGKDGVELAAGSPIQLDEKVAKKFAEEVIKESPDVNTEFIKSTNGLMQAGMQKVEEIYTLAKMSFYAVTFGGITWGISNLAVPVTAVGMSIMKGMHTIQRSL